MGAKFNFSNAIAGLEKLKGPLKESLSRRMGVAGGRVIRDEAKLRAPIYTGTFNTAPSNRGASERGQLARSIYVAYNKRASNQTQVVYSVSWNSNEAWWAKFVEFGWSQKYEIVYDRFNDVFWTDKTKPLDSPKRHPARPFLRPAFDAKMDDALRAAIDAGRIEFPKLMSGL